MATKTNDPNSQTREALTRTVLNAVWDAEAAGMTKREALEVVQAVILTFRQMGG